MFKVASALAFVLAANTGGFTKTCQYICLPETIYMPAVPIPAQPPEWSPAQNSGFIKPGWVPKSH